MGDLPSHSLPTHVHPGLFLGATGPHMFILVYFQRRPAHTLTWSIFMGDLPSHSHWSIFRGDLPTHVHPRLFSGAIDPHTHTVYFHGRPALTLILVYFHERLAHTCSSWSIFRSNRPSHSVFFHGWPALTLILVYFHGRPATHVHSGIFSGATGPHTHTVYFYGRPDTTKRLMSSPKCRSVEVINNPARPGSNHREVNCINYN
jgi:hypothetical protein